MTHAFDSTGKVVAIQMEEGVETFVRKHSIAQLKTALATFVPTEQQLRRAAAWLIHACDIADTILKVAVIATVVFLAIEIAWAFLPGGAVERVLGGAR
jgi:hypothetical protein